MKPSLGRIVHYVISEHDAEAINRRRDDFRIFNRKHRLTTYNVEPQPGEFPGRSGHIGHFGNEVREGDVYPATVVAVWGDTGCANIKVWLDGNDDYWATSRLPGDGPGQWFWPPRV